jgi:2-dehydropantoate 2-reductase
MKHAILGAGGVGGLMAAALVRTGEEVTLVLRPETYLRHPERIKLESPLGNFDVPVARAMEMNEFFDVVWLTVKATQLDAATETLQSAGDCFGIIVPLLNGVDHVARLRELFGDDHVVPATISVESERVTPGHIVHRSPFVRLALAANGKPKLEEVARKLTEFGFTCEFVDDEKTLLWRKLVFLAPLALTSSASGKTTGGMREDPTWHERLRAIVKEAGAVARAEGAKVDVDATLAKMETLPPGMKSSMQKDVDAGRSPELEAIGGPILRGGEKHGIATPVTLQLMEMIQARRVRQPS